MLTRALLSVALLQTGWDVRGRTEGKVQRLVLTMRSGKPTTMVAWLFSSERIRFGEAIFWPTAEVRFSDDSWSLETLWGMQNSVSEKCQIHLRHDIILIHSRSYYCCYSLFFFCKISFSTTQTTSFVLFLFFKYFKLHVPAFVSENGFNHQSIFPNGVQALTRPNSWQQWTSSWMEDPSQGWQTDEGSRSSGKMAASRGRMLTQTRLGI